MKFLRLLFLLTLAPLLASAQQTSRFGNIVVTGSATFQGTLDIPANALAISDTSGLQTALDAKQPLDADLTTWAGITPGTGVGTALAVNTGSAGAFVVNGGALGTPSSGVGTNLTALNATQLTTGTLPAARMPALTGDVTTTAGAVATTLATVNSNVGSFGSATAAPTFTVNAKGLLTAAGSTTVTPAWTSITGKPTTVATSGLIDAVATSYTLTTTAPLTIAGTTSANFTANRTLAINAASESATGSVELATAAETITGTDTARAVHPAGFRAALDARFPSAVLADAIRLTGLGGAFQPSSIGAFGTGEYLLTGFARVDALSGTQTIRGGATNSFVLSVNSSGQIVISKQGGSTVYTSTAVVTANVTFYYEAGRTGTGSNLAWLKINGGTAEVFTDASDYTVGITMLGETGSASNRLTGLAVRCSEHNTAYNSTIRQRFFDGLAIIPTEYRRASQSTIVTTNWAEHVSSGVVTVTGSSPTGFTAVNATGGTGYINAPVTFPAREYPVVANQRIRFKITLTGTVPVGTTIYWENTFGTAVALSTGTTDAIYTAATSTPNRRPTISVPAGSNFTASAIEVLPQGALSIMDNGSENAGAQLQDVSGNNRWFDLSEGGAIINNPGEFGRINFYRTSTGYLGLGYVTIVWPGYAIDRIKVWADGSIQMGVFDTGADYLASFTPAANEDASISYSPLIGGRANTFPSMGLKLNTATFAEGGVTIRRYR
ncbi:MAG: hypothetical protein H7067_15350 [Burkholderiales bacterium]|nr:hypothetical protein [Opitutaceae bacterium]